MIGPGSFIDNNLVGIADVRWAYFIPAAPTGVTAVPFNAQVALSWTAPASIAPALTNYIIQYSSDSGSTWSNFARAASTATSATVTGLTNDTAYVFRVASVNPLGTGPYSAASNSVTPAADPYFPYVSLLLHMDGNGSTFVDSSGSPKTITANGNATQSLTQSKFGGKSLFLDGSGDYLTVPSITFGSGDFAIEGWLYFNTISNTYTGVYDGRITNIQGATPTLILNQNAISWYTNGNFQITGSSLSTGQWYYVAVARSSGSTRMYINGAQVGQTYSDYTNYGSTNTPLIGKLFDGYEMNGYIDEFRITVGSARGYTGSTIAVPTTPFPNA